MALNLKHQTVEQLLARVRARYLASEGAEACRLAEWLTDALDSGDVTDAQGRQAWSMTTAQWASFKGRMNAQRQNWRAVKEAKGE